MLLFLFLVFWVVVNVGKPLVVAHSVTTTVSLLMRPQELLQNQVSADHSVKVSAPD